MNGCFFVYLGEQLLDFDGRHVTMLYGMKRVREGQAKLSEMHKTLC